MMYSFLKAKVNVCIIVTFYFLCACSLSGGKRETIIYYTPTFYKYNIAKKTYTKITSLDEAVYGFNNFYQYLQDQKVVFVNRYTDIQIIDINNGSKTSITLDSLIIQDSFLSASPVENKVAFVAERKNATYGVGLYVLDLGTRKIKVIKSTNNDTREKEYFRYYQPSFSNNGKIISYIQLHSYINKDLVDNPWVDENSLWIYDLSTSKQKEICHGFQYFSYPIFDKSDENIYFQGTGLFKVNLALGQIDPIDTIHPYLGSYDGLPPYLITASGLFYSQTSKEVYPQEHEMYYYDATSRKSSFLIQGFMPMSESSKNGDILIRSNSNYDDVGSPIYIINKNGHITDVLKPAMRAIFIPDGENILLLIFDVSFIDS